MKDYTSTTARIATVARQRPETWQPRPRFTEGDRVRLHLGTFRGCMGRVLREVAGYYEVQVWGVGGDVTILVTSQALSRA